MDNTIFYYIEAFIEWLQETGLLDALSDMWVEISIGSITAFLTLLFSSIAGLAVGGAILTGMIISAVAVAIVSLAFYLMRAIGLTKIGKKLGVRYRILAWIPYANAYYLGACAEKSMTRNGKKTWKWGWFLLLSTVGIGVGQPLIVLLSSIVSCFIPGSSLIFGLLLQCASIAILVVTGYCLWCIFKEFMDNAPAIILAILGPLFGNLVAVLLFIVSFFRIRPASFVKIEDNYDASETDTSNQNS